MLTVAGAADSSLVALERLHARESGGRTLAGASPRATTGDRSASDAFAAELASEDQPRAPQVPAAASAITSCAGQTCVCLLQENSVVPHLLLASEDAMTCGSGAAQAMSSACADFLLRMEAGCLGCVALLDC